MDQSSGRRRGIRCAVRDWQTGHPRNLLARVVRYADELGRLRSLPGADQAGPVGRVETVQQLANARLADAVRVELLKACEPVWNEDDVAPWARQKAWAVGAIVRRVGGSGSYRGCQRDDQSVTAEGGRACEARSVHIPLPSCGAYMLPPKPNVATGRWAPSRGRTGSARPYPRGIISNTQRLRKPCAILRPSRRSPTRWRLPGAISRTVSSSARPRPTRDAMPVTPAQPYRIMDKIEQKGRRLGAFEAHNGSET